MKKIILILIGLVLIGFGVYGIFIKKDNSENVTKYSNNDYSFEFDYQKGKEGYVLKEVIPSEENSQILKTIILIPSEYENQIPDASEGPPTISISIFKNVNNLSPELWAIITEKYSNINLKLGEINQTTIGENKAIVYVADGLYATDTIITTRGSYVYMLNGMFIDSNSKLREDFINLVKTFKFVD